MANRKKYLQLCLTLVALFQLSPGIAQTAGQTLTLPQALQIAAANYQLLQAKENYARASAEAVQAAKKDALPDVTVAAQNAYGTLNGMNGLSSGLVGITAITAGPVFPSQNGTTAFGALYLSNINWNIFSFGLQRANVAAARGQYDRDLADLEQEKFQQQGRVAVAYLNLLTAQRLRLSMENNLQRASQLRDIILRRTDNGLNPGVDSSIANSELSRARLSLTDAINYEQSQTNQLSVQLGIPPQPLGLDTSFVIRLPKTIPPQTPANISQHPILQFMDRRVKASDLTAAYLHKTSFPRFSLFGVGQERGSGFGSNYASNTSDYTTSYFKGINPTTANYLLGIGVTWNITDLTKTRSRVRSQQYLSAALKNEYHLEENQLLNQLSLADQQIGNALTKYKEAPFQLKSAQDAYQQKTALYENGLTNIVDVAQTLYTLNRAETDSDISCNAVWQALLYKAITTGDMNLFLSQY
ncbi:MAG TPA: TolC family protein [Puia sp.]|nr:TolC family protein [Puia sp.]